jgi:AcrR family transcriptional regulator
LAINRNRADQSATGSAPFVRTAERPSAAGERQRREDRLLDAATKLMVRWGYRKTTIDDVAREAGVGKGTVYLHWKDKNELFRAAILRSQKCCGEDIQRRIAADPDGGLLHRVIIHTMLAALSYPLIIAMISGKSDIFDGFMEAYNPGYYQQLTGEATAYMVQMQQAGLIRADIPVASMTYLLAALKIGMVSAPELLGQEKLPDMEELTETLSDLIRRWLEPAQLPPDRDAGKQLYAVYADNLTQPE